MRFNGRPTTDAGALTALVAADGSSGGFLKDSQAGAGGLALLDDADLEAVRQTLELFTSARLLFSLSAANMNIDTDQAFTKHGTFTTYLLNSGRVTAASTSLTTAAGGVYTGAGKTGNQLVISSQAYSALTSSSLALGTSSTAAGLGVQTATPFLSLTTPQGEAATADFRLFGFPLT